jgi:hypothetical protein
MWKASHNLNRKEVSLGKRHLVLKQERYAVAGITKYMDFVFEFKKNIRGFSLSFFFVRYIGEIRLNRN